jgi:dihydrofolate reductase
LTIIAALDKNRVVGNKNKMPWHISEDFKHFKRTTLNHPIIMGRKTFESIGSKPLPNRHHIIVSRTMAESQEVDVSRSLDEAIEKARTYGSEIYICGGVEIYRQAIPLSDFMILSHIDGQHEGDAYFPEFDEAEWVIAKKDGRANFTIVYYERKISKI